MEIINQGLEQLASLIVWPYLASFLLLSYLVKKTFEKWLNSITSFTWKTVYTVLVIATLLSIPFILFYDADWSSILLTYALGTSFHELILGKIIDKIKN